ncbi:hypothetical protein GCM10010277_80430 [Streptomyces longisporoflavus]|uniref:hypothetical protein n=1 Tax=Streptomyces longisporoflavus TaxID=28044 RepID=UPI00167E446B|nr:hypothetical protein [Streptomyces longisporoflavus]GGV69916.1 hypothetical protein GCM10010277_80430 [Streptomyces longisporoflavus]
MRVAITGHRGLSRDVEEQVRTLLACEVSRYDAAQLVALSCIADGPDAWFAEAVLAAGGRLEVIVPADRYRAGLPRWHHGVYDALLSRAARVHHTGISVSDSAAHMAGSELLVRLADELLAVWDGQPARGHGGTADVAAYAQHTDTPVRILWPHGASR